jgi:hypothetical protein
MDLGSYGLPDVLDDLAVLPCVDVGCALGGPSANVSSLLSWYLCLIGQVCDPYSKGCKAELSYPGLVILGLLYDLSIRSQRSALEEEQGLGRKPPLSLVGAGSRKSLVLKESCLRKVSIVVVRRFHQGFPVRECMTAMRG